VGSANAVKFYGKLVWMCVCSGKNFMSNECLFAELLIYHVSHALITIKS